MMVQKHCCENCQRSSKESQIERYTMQGHVAYLCPTCAYVLVREEQPERFLALCRRAPNKQLNEEMKKIHVMLSQFILIGLFFVTIITASIVVQLQSEGQQVVASEQEEYLSFLKLSEL